MSRDPQAKKKRFGCSPGCQITLVVLVIVVAIAGYFSMQPINEAKQFEQDLIDRHGTVSAYVPAPDGAVAADRMEIFLAVRTELLAKTGHIQEVFAQIAEADQKEELSAREGLSMLGLISGAVNKMVEFYSVRNGELMEHGMGLGEYFYIFALAYGEQLCPLDPEGRTSAENQYVTGRTTRELTQVLRNQLEKVSHSHGGEIASALREEIAAMENGDRALPWLSRRPDAVTASLAPYVDRLDGLYCLATRELELGQKNKNLGGFGD